MNIGLVCNRGDSRFKEDGYVLGERLFGVLDGYSTPYSPEHPMQKFNGLSGGEMIVRFCERFALEQEEKNIISLCKFILRMNEGVRKEQEKFNVPFNAADLAGASFVFVRFKEVYAEVVQAGDCLATLELKNGQVIVTPNQVRHHDEVMHSEIEQLMRQTAKELFNAPLEEIPRERLAQVRSKMWNLFYPILRKARQENANNPDSLQGYGVLNGQPELEKMLFKESFETEEIKRIIILSDGMISQPIKDNQALGQKILEEFERGGLDRLLLKARQEQKRKETTAYVSRPEATAVAIEF